MIRWLPSAIRCFSQSNKLVDLIFVEEANAKQIKIKAQVGSTLLQIARQNKVNLEAACEGGCACATCHVIIDKDHYSKFPKPQINEEDCLDNAFGLTNTSRLACQATVSESVDGAIITVPSATRNVDFSKQGK